MAGPNKQFNQEQALDKALDVFWNKGFEATSMQDLINQMGINRASLYQTFGNKYDLFIASLDRYIEINRQQIHETLKASGSPLDNLYQLFLHFIRQAENKQQSGCFINNTAVELGPHDAQVAEKIRQFWKQLEHMIIDALNRAIEKNQLPSGTDTKRLASLLNINLQGLVIKSKTSASQDELINSTDLLFSLIRKQ